MPFQRGHPNEMTFYLELNNTFPKNSCSFGTIAKFQETFLKIFEQNDSDKLILERIQEAHDKLTT